MSTNENQANPWNTFRIELEVRIVASPEQVFDALTQNISAWWGAPYLLGNATKIVLEPFVGGRLYEVWGENTGALWANVSKIRPPRELSLVGPIGLPEPSHGITTFQLSPNDNGTVVHFTHEAFGKISQKIEKGYAEGWKDLLLKRLPAYIESATEVLP